MRPVVVVNRTADWNLRVPGVEIVSADDYLLDEVWVTARHVLVYNLCRNYKHQTKGYYVSLLAAARGHKPFPSLSTILDMKSRSIVRLVDDDLEQIVNRSLAAIRSDRFTLSVYFGANPAARHDKLALALFNRFPAPLLRAEFAREAGGDRPWHLTSMTPIPTREIPPSHLEFFESRAADYFARPRFRSPKRARTRWDLAVLYDAQQEFKPSDEKALRRFSRAAERQGIACEIIGKDDLSRLAEFDALFIRDTTYVNHHTFRFAQSAEQQGLVVIDDTQSILRCTNKVFLAEAMRAKRVPMPRTVVANRHDAERIEREVGLPCVLKHPESSFSQGVVRCADRQELERRMAELMVDTELIVAQEFVPTDYDWRIGTLGGEPLWACRYHMAKGHWQIIKRTSGGQIRYGQTDTVPLAEVPAGVLRAALKAAQLIGDGLYGVDVKQFGRRLAVMEVNDNPNLDMGYEDAELGDELWDRLVSWFATRLEQRTRR